MYCSASLGSMKAASLWVMWRMVLICRLWMCWEADSTCFGPEVCFSFYLCIGQLWLARGPLIWLQVDLVTSTSGQNQLISSRTAAVSQILSWLGAITALAHSQSEPCYAPSVHPVPNPAHLFWAEETLVLYFLKSKTIFILFGISMRIKLLNDTVTPLYMLFESHRELSTRPLATVLTHPPQSSGNCVWNLHIM